MIICVVGQIIPGRAAFEDAVPGFEHPHPSQERVSFFVGAIGFSEVSLSL